MESGAFIAASAAGELNGFHLLGWGADYPHITNFTDYHFGATAGAVRHRLSRDLHPAARRGADTRSGGC